MELWYNKTSAREKLKAGEVFKKEDLVQRNTLIMITSTMADEDRLLVDSSSKVSLTKQSSFTFQFQKRSHRLTVRTFGFQPKDRISIIRGSILIAVRTRWLVGSLISCILGDSSAPTATFFGLFVQRIGHLATN